MRVRRLLAIVVLAGLLAPGTWVRSPPPVANDSQELTLTPLAVRNAVSGEVTLDGAWHMTSPNSQFGSYSALVFLDENRFLAGSDHGRLLEFDAPDESQNRRPVLSTFSADGDDDKFNVDLESLTRDPATGRIWAGFESLNAIERVGPDMGNRVTVQPAAMEDWSGNSGPESLVRLQNGRFLVIAEGSANEGGPGFPVILFAGDPIDEPAFETFRFQPPKGYRPVDATQLPDGRILILVRDFTIALPPRFATKLVVADLADLTAAMPWRGREIASIADPPLADNYEGVAAAADSDGTLSIWLISDDNGAIYQRTLLLKLNWNPEN